MDKDVYTLLDLANSKHIFALAQLYLLESALNNTKRLTWWELLQVRCFSTPAGGLLFKGTVYEYRKYKSKTYCILP